MPFLSCWNLLKAVTSMASMAPTHWGPDSINLMVLVNIPMMWDVTWRRLERSAKTHSLKLDHWWETNRSLVILSWCDVRRDGTLESTASCRSKSPKVEPESLGVWPVPPHWSGCCTWFEDTQRLVPPSTTFKVSPLQVFLWHESWEPNQRTFPTYSLWSWWGIGTNTWEGGQFTGQKRNHQQGKFKSL